MNQKVAFFDQQLWSLRRTSIVFICFTFTDRHSLCKSIYTFYDFIERSPTSVFNELRELIYQNLKVNITLIWHRSTVQKDVKQVPNTFDDYWAFRLVMKGSKPVVLIWLLKKNWVNECWAYIGKHFMWIANFRILYAVKISVKLGYLWFNQPKSKMTAAFNYLSPIHGNHLICSNPKTEVVNFRTKASY